MMKNNPRRSDPHKRQPVDLEVIEESALAIAQAGIQNAIDDAGMLHADFARAIGCPRSYVSRILSGSHNLTVKMLARSLAAAGFGVVFQRVPLR